MAHISKFDGPYITTLASRASYTSSSSRLKLDKVEDYFKMLKEMGFGRNCCEGKSFVFYRVTPTDIEQDQLDHLGNTLDQYSENYAKTPPEITCGFAEKVAILPQEPGNSKKAKANEDE